MHQDVPTVGEEFPHVTSGGPTAMPNARSTVPSARGVAPLGDTWLDLGLVRAGDGAFVISETRYTMLAHSDSAAAGRLLAEAQEDARTRWRTYEQLAAMPGASSSGDGHA